MLNPYITTFLPSWPLHYKLIRWWKSWLGKKADWYQQTCHLSHLSIKILCLDKILVSIHMKNIFILFIYFYPLGNNSLYNLPQLPLLSIFQSCFSQVPTISLYYSPWYMNQYTIKIWSFKWTWRSTVHNPAHWIDFHLPLSRDVAEQSCSAAAVHYCVVLAYHEESSINQVCIFSSSVNW